MRSNRNYRRDLGACDHLMPILGSPGMGRQAGWVVLVLAVAVVDT
jgi:hypothetical protein